MNWASARCSRARSPRRNEKRAPDTLAAVAKSSRPSASPTSVWSFGAKPKVRGVPQRRTSTLSASERPTGVDAWVRLGRSSRKSRSPRWTRSSSPSRRFVSSPMPATSARIADASSPRPFSAPICFDSALRFACRSCVRVWMSLRSSSSAVKRAASSVTPRLASPAATPARSVRRRLMSSIRPFYQRLARRLPVAAQPAFAAMAPPCTTVNANEGPEQIARRSPMAGTGA